MLFSKLNRVLFFHAGVASLIFCHLVELAGTRAYHGCADHTDDQKYFMKTPDTSTPANLRRIIDIGPLGQREQGEGGDNTRLRAADEDEPARLSGLNLGHRREVALSVARERELSGPSLREGVRGGSSFLEAWVPFFLVIFKSGADPRSTS